MNLKKKMIGTVKQNRQLRKLALKVYSVKYPPPYRRPNMEFEFDAWNGISSLHCWNGHQIGEENSGPYPYNEITRNEHKTCPFKDSRKGLQMNVATLRTAMPSAEDALRLIALFRKKYIARRHLNQRRLNLAQAYLFSKFAVCLPAYMTRRRESPVREGRLQPVETAFYMLGTAAFMLTRRLMSVGDPAPLDPRPMSDQRLYELADTSSALISVRACACPASPKLIRNLFDIMMNGNIDGPTSSPEVQRVLDTLGDWDRYYDYAHASSRIELLIRLNLALNARLLHTVVKNEMLTNARLARTALRTTLNRIQVRKRADINTRDILDNFIEILILLVKDHDGDTTLDSLDMAGCLDNPALLPSGTPQEAASLLRHQHDIIYHACRRDVDTVHRALGHPDWPDIALEDLYLRTGGSGLTTLIKQLEIPKVKRPYHKYHEPVGGPEVSLGGES